MTIKELRERLEQENVPQNSYSLDGGMPNDKYCLEKTTVGWEVYYSEMGGKREVKTFILEEKTAKICTNV